jgi:hypothetical protein
VALVAASAASLAQTAPLVNSNNLTYLGSFKLPTVSGNGFTYGGNAPAYNADNDSLYIVGHVYDQKTGEIKIPAVGGTATLLQPLTDSLAGKLSAVGGSDIRIGGNMVYQGTLYTTAFVYYDGSGSQILSNYSRPLALSSGAVIGPWRVGSMGAGFYSGYMAPVPTEWQAKFGGPAVTGNCCLSILSRTSYGPALFSYDPKSILQTAKPLVYYTQDHQTLGKYGASGSNPMFNGSTRITGVVFPQGTSSVLFFGRTGTGSYCYGESAACGDLAYDAKGEHAYPYVAYVWAYNANDLAAVRAGTKQPYEVVPYATWQLPQMKNSGSIGEFDVGGAAYDPATGRIFVPEAHANGTEPIVHVYKVNNSSLVAAPMPPSSVTVQ